jgi:hypothetical protein
MSKERFLLWMLASIFAYQASIFAFGLYTCSRVTPQSNITDVCPEIGRRYDNTFNVAIATVLALLTGSSLRKDV